ncbi:hypothetical protein TSUD_181210 [Trifolium subterraneum]|uniref:Uncharacterized protein n=1 Tax=Trifolium subterraneum TaxID=3900 RepID=A0A2Z6MEV1_TRISU|nr:hypothetical protein TSUD_181210 [Trifolium subterraneum]
MKKNCIATVGDFCCVLRGLELAGGETLAERECSGEQKEAEEHEIELDSPLLTAAMAENALREDEPVPPELSRPPREEPLGE